MIAVFAWLLIPSPAGAAEVHVNSGCYKEDCWLDAVYTAAPGETNRLTVERTSDTTLVFRDAGAAV